MRISFDIDDTLICNPAIPSEQPLGWWQRWRYPEPLRRGTRALMAALVQRQCTIWLYTSSCRCPRYLKAWFASLDIPIEGVVNQARHEHLMGWRGPSKFPPAFGIDLHVDDSLGVAMEGADHRFAVLMIAPEDPDWVQRVLDEVDVRLQAKAEPTLNSNAAGQSLRMGRLWRQGFGRVGRIGWADSPLPEYAIDFARPDAEAA